VCQRVHKGTCGVSEIWSPRQAMEKHRTGRRGGPKKEREGRKGGKNQRKGGANLPGDKISPSNFEEESPSPKVGGVVGVLFLQRNWGGGGKSHKKRGSKTPPKYNQKKKKRKFENVDQKGIKS